MDDSKRGLNLVSTTVSNIRNDILSLAGSVQNQLLPQVRAVVAEFQKIHNLMGGLTASQTRGAVILGQGGSNKVADNGMPAANGAGTAGGGGTNKVSTTPPPPTPPGNAFTRAVGAVGGYAAASNLIATALPSPSVAVQQDLLTAQSAFYGQGGFGGTLGQQTGNVRALQNKLAATGTAINSMDSTRALAMAQSLGLSGATNFNQVMQGIATASNFAPGLGIQGTTQAYGTVNAPQTVNMLRTVGINVRGPNGQLLPLPQVAEQLWTMINQNIPGGKLSERDVQIGLMPGNGLYGMLTSLFGGDSATITIISNMLLAKARSGGGMNLSKTDRADLEKMGLSTATVNKMARQTAGQTKLLTTTASAQAAGIGVSADLGNALNNFAAAAGPLTQALAAVSGAQTGIMGLGNGVMGTLLKSGLGAFIGGTIGTLINPGVGTAVGASIGANLFRAEGGPVDGSAPYVVGEKGPELFVPKSDGVIVPNHLLGNPHRKDGGPVKGMKTGDDLADFLVGQGFTRAGAEGVVGNLVWESGLDTTIIGDSGTSYGLAQWHGGRWDNLKKFAKSKGLDPSTAEAQMQFLMKELKQKQYKNLVATLKDKDTTKLEAAAAFMRQFERPANQSDSMARKRANSYKGELGLTSSGGVTDSSTGAAGIKKIDMQSLVQDQGGDYQSAIQSVIGSARSAAGLTVGSGGGGTANTFNNSVTINISGTNDPKKIADEVQKEFARRKILVQAGNG